MDAFEWQMPAVAAATVLLLLADLALRRHRRRTGTVMPSAEHLDALIQTRHDLEAVGPPLARQAAIAESRVTLLADAVRDAAAGRALVALADAARHIGATDRRFTHAERSASVVIAAKERGDGE